MTLDALVGGREVAWCPLCGAHLQLSFVAEYWQGDDCLFLTWCQVCSATTQVRVPQRLTATEPEH